MVLFDRKDALESAWLQIEKEEKRFLEKRAEKKQSVLSDKLEEKVPKEVSKVLDRAFENAFTFIFEKAAGTIEKTYNKEKIEKEHKVRRYATQIKKDKASFNALSYKAKQSGVGNLVLSGSVGMGMGAIGIGLPDIPLLTSMMLKSIYEMALYYGFSYETIQEKQFILLMLQGAFSYGTKLWQINESLNTYIEKGLFKEEIHMKKEIQKTSKILADELIAMKFLQGIPIVGAIGGVYDAVYMGKLTNYVEMKYRKRYLFDEKLRKKK